MLLQRQDREVVVLPLALVESGAVGVGIAEHGEARHHALDLRDLKAGLRAAHDAVLAGAWFMAVCGLVLSYYAALTYVPIARDALRDGRRASAPAASETVS